MIRCRPRSPSPFAAESQETKEHQNSQQATHDDERQSSTEKTGTDWADRLVAATAAAAAAGVRGLSESDCVAASG